MSLLILNKLIDKLQNFELDHPGILQPEFLDWLDMLPAGQKKHGNTWLDNEGNNTMDKDSQMASISRHAAKMLYGRPIDESGYPHSYHLICRATMQMVRDKRNLVHEKDKPSPQFLAKAGGEFTGSRVPKRCCSVTCNNCSIDLGGS